MFHRALLLGCVFLSACQCGNTVTTGGSGGGGGHDGGAPTLTSIAVQPPTATFDVQNDVAPPQSFTAVGTFSDGHTETLTSAAFFLDSAGQRLGTLAGTSFTASGAHAGTGTLTARLSGIDGTAQLTVTLHDVRLDPSAPAGAAANFPASPPTGGAGAQTLDYPLDGAVMPATVGSPVVQWEGSSVTGDLHRVVLSRAGVTIEGILAHDASFTFSYRPSLHDWEALASGGGDLTVVVDHYDATNGAQRSAPVHVHVADAEVTGTIYYWDLSQGQLQRLDATGRALAIPKPPISPTMAGDRCVACHAISQNGRYLAAEMWGGSGPGAVYDLSNPATSTADPAPTVTPAPNDSPPTPYVALFSTFNPDATRLMVNVGNALQLVDPMTGAAVTAQGVALPADHAAHPCWSPDGTAVAYIANTDGPWGVDYTAGDVALLPVTAADTFGAPQILVSSSTGDPSVKAASWPTFSPDSQLIAYAAGTNSRGRANVNMAEVIYPGSLFLVPRAGGAPTRLDTACSGQPQCYLPNFSPYDSGGYFWLVFYSLREYGNAYAGTKGVQPPRRQMWVTAIDKSKLASGGDPSSVPYWLPDQDTQTENMSAFWALPPPIQ